MCVCVCMHVRNKKSADQQNRMKDAKTEAETHTHTHRERERERETSTHTNTSIHKTKSHHHTTTTTIGNAIPFFPFFFAIFLIYSSFIVRHLCCCWNQNSLVRAFAPSTPRHTFETGVQPTAQPCSIFLFG